MKYENDYPWVSASSKGDTYALCKWCNVSICIGSVGSKGLRDHEITARHKRNQDIHLEALITNQNVSDNAQNHVVPPPVLDIQQSKDNDTTTGAVLNTQDLLHQQNVGTLKSSSSCHQLLVVNSFTMTQQSLTDTSSVLSG